MYSVTKVPGNCHHGCTSHAKWATGQLDATKTTKKFWSWHVKTWLDQVIKHYHNMITVSTRYDHQSALASSCFFLPYPPPPSMNFASPAVFFLGALPRWRCSLETKNRRKKIAFTAQFGAPMDAKINKCMSRKRNSLWNTIYPLVN